MENKELIYREDLIAEYDRVHQGPAGGARKLMVDAPAVDALVIPEGGVGEVSDGCHTFNELYHHRAILFSVICNANPDKAWKSKLHDTGDMFEGMFIVGIETEEGQATYHYDIEPYWDMFKVKELERAPKWDGHTPEQAIERIKTLDAVEVVRCKDCIYSYRENDYRFGYTCVKPLFHPNLGEITERKLMQDIDFCSYGVRRR